MMFWLTAIVQMGEVAGLEGRKDYPSFLVLNNEITFEKMMNVVDFRGPLGLGW